MTQIFEQRSDAKSTKRGMRGHRADIEGLRALSIIMIMVWHAGVTWFPGGFVSLDVFFVISGFLITQLLVKEIRMTGRLRLRRFYGRRAKRLLPAPAVVLVVVALLAWLLLPRTRWTSTAQDIIVTALYGMNWRLAAQSVDYFQQDAAVSVLEHFWSLSAEEQFYLGWPCLLAGAAIWGKRHGVRRRHAVLAAMVLLGVASFAWSVYYSTANPGAAYFVTTTRAWEFALGGAFAMLTFTRHRLPRPVAIVVGWTGLATILVAAVYVTTDLPYPGYWAMIPCLATIAIIVAGFTAGPGGPVALLGTAPMQFVGRLSYSLYLCHWPAVAFTAAVLGRVLTPVEGLLAIAASVVPAYLLHRYVENPIRYSKTMFRDSAHMLRAAAVVTVVTVTAGMLLHLANWPPTSPFVRPAAAPLDSSAAVPAQPVPTAESSAVLGAAVLREKPLGDPAGAPRDTAATIVPDPVAARDDYTQCTQIQQSAEVRTCVYGDRNSSTVVAVVGDSHANQWVPGLIEVAKNRRWKLVEYTKAACSFADVLVVTKDGQPYDSCQEWGAAVLQRLLTTEKPTMVITSELRKRVWLDGRVAYDDQGRTALAAGLRRYYQQLTGAGAQVVILQDSPSPGINIPDCVAANPTRLTACAGDRTAWIPADHGSEQFEAARDLPGVSIVDLNDAICPTDRCSAVIGNVLLYRDTSHLTGTYVRSLVPRLDARIPAT